MDCIHLLYYQQAHCQIILLCYLQTHYLTEYYCCATRRPTTRLYTTILLHAGPLPDRIFLVYYPQAKLQDCIFYTLSDTQRPTTRLFTNVLLRTGPLLDCLLLFWYPQANYQTEYMNYCSATHGSITRLNTTVHLPTVSLPDRKLQFCYA